MRPLLQHNPQVHLYMYMISAFVFGPWNLCLINLLSKCLSHFIMENYTADVHNQ